jgi:amino acid transporter
MSARLKANSLSLFESLIMGVAGSAPGYTIAITTAVLLSTAGTLAPVALIIFAIPMLGIAVAYKALNKHSTNAGAAFQWTTVAFGKLPGFFSGWALLIASVVFMVAGSVPIATTTLTFIDPTLTSNVVLTAAVSSAWFLLIAIILIRGIEITSQVQVVMTVVELVILTAVLIAAFVHAATVGAINPFRWNWLSLDYSPATLATTALAVVFFYWGWDVTSNLSEETVNGGDNAGNGGFSSVVITIFFYIGFTVAALFLYSLHDTKSLSDNLVYNIAITCGWGRTGGLVASFAVILSSIATLETTMLQFSRTLFAMGRDGAMPRHFSVIAEKNLTPVRTMYALIAIGLALIWSSSLMPTVNSVVAASVNAVAVQVAYYYGLAGMVAAWEFRKTPSIGKWLLLCLYPAVSGLIILLLGIYAITTFDFITKVVALGGFLLGIVFFRPRGYGKALDILPIVAE